MAFSTIIGAGSGDFPHLLCAFAASRENGEDLIVGGFVYIARIMSQRASVIQQYSI
jgi:hypothetical protein